MALSGPTLRGTRLTTTFGATSSFTPNNNSLLVAVLQFNSGGQEPIEANFTISDSQSLIWTKHLYSECDSTSTWDTVTIVWSAQVTTGTSMTVTCADSTPLEALNGLSFRIYEYTGHEFGNPIGGTLSGTRTAGNDGLLSDTLSSSPLATSDVLASVVTGVWTGISANTIVAGTGWTQLFLDYSTFSETQVQIQHRNSSTSSTVLWDDVDNSNYDYVTSYGAVEVKELTTPLAPVLLKNVNGSVSAGDPVTYTTTSFTPSNDVLLVAVVYTADSSSSLNPKNCWLSDSVGLTWTKRTSHYGTDTTYYHVGEIYTAEVATGASMTVTHSRNGTRGNPNSVCGIQVFEVANYNPTMSIGATMSEVGAQDGADSGTLSSTPASSSLIFGTRVCSSDGAGDIGATPGTGWTELAESSGAFGWVNIQTQYKVAPSDDQVTWTDVATGADTIYDPSPGIMAIEIRAPVAPVVLTYRGAGSNGVQNASVTSSSFTPTNNSLLIAVATMQRDDGATDPTRDLSDNLSHTWTLVHTSNISNDFDILLGVWTTEIGTGAPMTVTMNPDYTASPAGMGIVVWDAVNYDPSNPIGLVAHNYGNGMVNNTTPYSYAIRGNTNPSSVLIGGGSADDGDISINTTGSWTEDVDNYEPANHYAIGHYPGATNTVDFSYFYTSYYPTSPRSISAWATEIQAEKNPLELHKRLSEASADSLGTGSYTTSSFTPAANSLLVVCAKMQANGTTTSNTDLFTISDSLSHTWTLQPVSRAVGGWYCVASMVWTTPITDAQPMTLTLDGVGDNDVINAIRVNVFDFTGYDQTNPIGATAVETDESFSGLSNVNLTLSAAPEPTSIVLAFLAYDTGFATSGFAAGPEWTEQYANLSIGYTDCQTQTRTGLDSTNVLWKDVAYNSNRTALALEIRSAYAPAILAQVDQTKFQFFADDDQLAYESYGSVPTISLANCVNNANNTASNPTVTYPAYSDGDLIIQFVAVDQNRTITVPATGPNGETANVICNTTGAGTNGPALAAIYWVANGTHAQGNTSWSLNTTDSWAGQGIKIPAGTFDPAKPIDVISAVGELNTDSTTADMPAFTADRPNGRIIVVGGVDLDPMDATYSPTGWTDLIDQDIGAVCSFSAYRDAGTSAGESVASASFGINITDSYACVGFVVNAPITNIGATEIGAINADPELDTSTNYRWRARVEASDDTLEDTWLVQYRHIEGSNTWTNVTTTSDVIRITASVSGSFTDGEDVPEYLYGSGSYVANNNAALDASNTVILGAALGAAESFELEICFQIRIDDVDDTDTIQLRVADSTGTELTTYTNTPTITVNEVIKHALSVTEISSTAVLDTPSITLFEITVPTLVDYYTSNMTTNCSTSIVSNSFSVETGDIIIVWAGQAADTSDNLDIAVSDSANNSYTLLEQDDEGPNPSGSTSYTRLWYAAAGNTTSLTVTTSCYGNTVSILSQHGQITWVWRNSDGIGNSELSWADGPATPTLSITTTKANSAMSVADLDWFANSTDGTWSSSPGTPTEIVDFADDTTWGVHGAYYADVGAVGAKTVAMTAPTAQRYALVAAEVKATSTEIGGGTALTVTEISDTAVLDTPTVGQYHNLSVTEISCTGVLDQPTVGQYHNLSVTEVSDTAVLDTPTTTEYSTLTVTEINSTGEVDQPELGQEHALSVTEISCTGVLDQPTVGQYHNFAVTEISSVGVVDQPDIGQYHNVAVTEISSTASLDQPTLTQIQDLAVTEVSSTAVLDQPDVGQYHNVAVTEISSTGFVGTPTAGESAYNLDVIEISTTGFVGTPTLVEVFVFSVTEISDTATLDQPDVGQYHNFAVTEITSTGFIDQPDVGQYHNLSVTEVSSTGIVDQATIGQSHTLTVTEITDTAILDQPTVGQEHALSVTEISSTATLDTPIFAEIHDLAVVEVSSAAFITQPDVGQYHNLSVTEISSTGIVDQPSIAEYSTLFVTEISSTGIVDQATVGQYHNLSVTEISSTAVLDTPILTEAGTFAVIEVSSVAVLEKPTLHQIQDLATVEISSTGIVDQPTVGQYHNVAITEISSTGIVDQATIGQYHNLSVTEISSTGVVDQPTTGQENALTVTEISSTAVLDQPSVAEHYVFAVTEISSTGIVDQATVGQKHALTVTEISSVGFIGTPIITEAGTFAVVEPTLGGVLDQPTLTQIHDLAVTEISSTSFVGTPSTSGIVDLAVTEISSASVIDTPTLTQIHDLAVTEIYSGANVDIPTFAQQHDLNIIEISSTPTLELPYSGSVHDLSVAEIVSIASIELPTAAQYSALMAVDIYSFAAIDIPINGQLHILSPTDIYCAPNIVIPKFIFGVPPLHDNMDSDVIIKPVLFDNINKQDSAERTFINIVKNRNNDEDDITYINTEVTTEVDN